MLYISCLSDKKFSYQQLPQQLGIGALVYLGIVMPPPVQFVQGGFTQQSCVLYRALLKVDHDVRYTV